MSDTTSSSATSPEDHEDDVDGRLPDDEAVEEIVQESEQALKRPPPGSDGSLGQYLHELQRYPVLSPDQEYQLAVLARDGNEQAQQALVNHNLRFVITVARRYSARAIALEDLIQQGNIGLMKAVERFNPDRGVKFISYAVYWINQSIRAWLASQQRSVRLPVNRATQLARLRRVRNRLRKETGEEPAAEDLAEEADVSLEMVRTLLKVSRPDLSFDTPARGSNGEEGVPLSERLSGPEDLDDRLERWCRDRNIERALERLRPRDRRVLELCYGLEGGRDHTLQEIGNMLGVTRERVRQIRDRALDELRERGYARALEDYAGERPEDG